MPSAFLGLTDRDGDEAARIDGAIAKTEAFFHSLGAVTRLADYGVPPAAAGEVAARLARRNLRFGEHQDIGSKEVEEIVALGSA